LPNQRSKKISSCRFHAFYIGWDGGLQIFSQNKLSGLPNGTSIAPSKSKFDAGSSVSPLNNSTYLSFNLGRRRNQFELINSVYANRKEKGACRAFKLVDPKATATTKKDQLIVYLKTPLPLYNWSNLKPIKTI
jgi:hypothetical protein